MSYISLTKKHPFNEQETRERLQATIHNTAKSLGLRYKWINGVCYFDGPARGKITIENDNVKVVAKLGFLASFVKYEIEEEIIRGLDIALS